MRAMGVHQFCTGAEVAPLNLPIPVPRRGEVVVRMAFASVNPADWKCADGWLQRFPQFKPTFPFGLGFDGSGLVVAVGEGVDAVKRADRVFVRGDIMNGQNGTFADFCRTTIDGVAQIPDAVSLCDAATVPTAGITAWQSLFRGASLKKGMHVLINGGSGGAGSFAVQFAKAVGAEVAATCSSPNVGYVQSLGADLVIDYTTDPIAETIRTWSSEGVDIVLDTVNLSASEDLLSIVKPGGTLVAIETLDLAARRHSQQSAASHKVALVEMTAIRAKSAEDLTSIGVLMAARNVRAPQTRLLKLEQAGEALELAKSGRVRGKLILEIGGEDLSVD